MPAQFAHPFLKSNKNDYLDAEAIAEAVQRPNVRSRRTISLTCRLSTAFGTGWFLAVPASSTNYAPFAHLRKQMPELLEDTEQRLSPRMRRLVDRLWQEWKALEEQVEVLSGEIKSIASHRTLRASDCWASLVSVR